MEQEKDIPIQQSIEMKKIEETRNETSREVSGDTPRSRKMLYRSPDKVLGGVCAGIAEYFDIDPTIIRVAFVLFTIFGGSGVILYVILWIVLPDTPEGFSHSEGRVRSVAQEMKERAHDGVKSLKGEDTTRENTSTWLAVLLVGVGAYFLLRNVGLTFSIFDFVSFRDIVPIALIVGGIYLYYRQK